MRSFGALRPVARSRAEAPTLASTESLPATTIPRPLAVPRIGASLLDMALLAPILGLALAMRLINLSTYSGLFDEGIRVEQLFLMSAGYRPFRDIFAAQGPLLLDLLHPWFVLFGQDLAAARLAVGVYSLVGLAAAYWVARLAAGTLGGVVAALLLLLSPLYLEGSRLALAEVPAMAPAILAVGAALVYQRTAARPWLIGAGVLLAASLLTKPITLAAAVPVCLAVLSRREPGGVGSRAKDLLLLGGIIAGLTTLVVVAVGLAGVFDQIVSYRLESRTSEGWSVWKNRAALVRALSFEQPALLGLAFGSAFLLLTLAARNADPFRRWAPVWLAAWTAASGVLLLAYSPLHGKHAVVMIPPVAILAGVGVGIAWRELRGSGSVLWRVVIGIVLAATLVWYAGTAPVALAQSGQLMRVTADSDVDPAVEQYADAVGVIRSLTGPRDFVVTDHPYLTFLAGRLVPPELVDTSRSRIRSRSLRAGEAVATAAQYQPPVVVLWTDRLRGLRDFKAWVEDNYRLVKVYNRRQDLDRGIYVRRDADLPAVRGVLELGYATRANADFGGDLRLVSYALDRTQLRRGEGAGLNMHWESLRPLSADYHVVTVIRAADGEAWDQQQESLAGGSVGTTEWEVGRWLFQNTFVRTDGRTPAGNYAVEVSVYDSRARRMVPLVDGTDHLTLGHLSIG